VFAYNGAAGSTALVPVYDSYDVTGLPADAGGAVHAARNWLQVKDISMDPVAHRVLHAAEHGYQFTEAFGAVPRSTGR